MPKGSLGNIQQILINMLKAESILFFNTHNKQVFIALPSIALKTRELDDATVNNHNPSCLSVLSRMLHYFSVGQPFSKQLYTYNVAQKATLNFTFIKS